MPKTYQIALGDDEKLKLVNRIEDDWNDDKSAHGARLERFAGYLKRWEGRVSVARIGEEDKPNHPVPVTRWNVFQKLARDMQSLIGDKAAITADPVGPSDSDKAQKVGCYMTSRVFGQMKLVTPLTVFEFLRILNGRAIAYRPWYRREFNTKGRGGAIKRVCDYEGPGFFPLQPDDIVVPGERGVDSIHDFSHCIRRYHATVDELQYGDGGLYQGTSEREFVERAIRAAQYGGNRSDTAGNPVRDEQERSKGVLVDGQGVGRQARRRLEVWEWYGYWRPLKKRIRDAELDDLERRMSYEADWVVRYLPELKEIIGVQDLLEIYPKMRRRRPFVDSSLIKDGSYWSQGFGQMLEDIETEGTAASRLFTAAGELSSLPVVFYKPGNGLEAQTFALQPGTAYPTEDPGSINVVQLNAKLDWCIAKMQENLANGERVTGITDQSLGRAVDRPNAPRTATGQLALIEEGNVRAWLDATILREDVEQIVTDIWELDCDLAPKSDRGLWFRVTEAAGSSVGFDTEKGGAYMTEKEFGGVYDFKLKMAVSVFSREAQAQKILSFYQLAMTNPLVASSPRALWVLLNRVAQALGIEDFGNIIPEPADLDQPITPEAEWTKMLEGDEEVHPNPQDHDDLHLMKHAKQLAESRRDPDADEQARNLLIRHIQETREQKAAKMAMQALTQELIRSIQPAGGGGAPDLTQVMGAFGGQGQPGPGAAPQAGPPAGNDMPLPGGAVGSSRAPEAHEGML